MRKLQQQQLLLMSAVHTTALLVSMAVQGLLGKTLTLGWLMLGLVWMFLGVVLMRPVAGLRPLLGRKVTILRMLTWRACLQAGLADR
jgi:hypothetical protein